jgi:hypothetical protein
MSFHHPRTFIFNKFKYYEMVFGQVTYSLSCPNSKPWVIFMAISFFKQNDN